MPSETIFLFVMGALGDLDCFILWFSVQAVTKSFTSQISRNFQQKFPPIMACNPISMAVAENLIGASDLEESSEGEDEATSGRKRIRSRHLLDGDP